MVLGVSVPNRDTHFVGPGRCRHEDRESNQVSAAVVPDTTKRELQAFAFDRIAEEAGRILRRERRLQGPAEPRIRQPRRGRVCARAGAHERHGVLLAQMKRGYYGTYHRMSPAHLQRYVNEFGRHKHARLRHRSTDAAGRAGHGPEAAPLQGPEGRTGRAGKPRDLIARRPPAAQIAVTTAATAATATITVATSHRRIEFLACSISSRMATCSILVRNSVSSFVRLFSSLVSRSATPSLMVQ